MKSTFFLWGCLLVALILPLDTRAAIMETGKTGKKEVNSETGDRVEKVLKFPIHPFWGPKTWKRDNNSQSLRSGVFSAVMLGVATLAFFIGDLPSFFVFLLFAAIILAFAYSIQALFKGVNGLEEKGKGKGLAGILLGFLVLLVFVLAAISYS